ncbi:hypothetical protein SCHPADRAFT_860149 [Schizopora paradoxa]|uniref:HIG1 domain-containing protein n=1 Tax=Schizopora paradoxa TaxID=27342 RepID=A0A0H2RDC7_9AGAM|nr:hypothetical protein SCHPADRAFT_860149 [Schizopora paradoxa]
MGGVKGFVGGLAFAVPASLIAQRRWPYYRSLPPNLKTFAGIAVVVPAFIICAERAHLKFEKTQWTGTGKVELDTLAARAQARWDNMSTTQKMSDFASRHQFSLLSGTWAASMLGVYGWLSRDPLATPFQKITQTRVWAQGMTLGILVSAALLTHGRKRVEHHDHSWLDIIEEEEAEAKQKKLLQNAPKA